VFCFAGQMFGNPPQLPGFANGLEVAVACVSRSCLGSLP
jgi:hypothetical protein